MQYIWVIYDILAVLLLLSYIHKGSRRGFAATVVNFIGYLIALAVAWMLAKAMAPALFESLFREGLLEKTEAALSDFPGTQGLADLAAGLLDSLPAYVAGMLEIGGKSVDDLAELLASYSEHSAQTVVDGILSPILVGVLSMVLFLIFFSILLIILRALVRGFEQVRNIPLVGPLNSILGGVMGVVTGVVALVVILLLIQLVLAITGDSLQFLNSDIIHRTTSYRLLRRFIPFLSLGMAG